MEDGASLGKYGIKVSSFCACVCVGVDLNADAFHLK